MFLAAGKQGRGVTDVTEQRAARAPRVGATADKRDNLTLRNWELSDVATLGTPRFGSECGSRKPQGWWEGHVSTAGQAPGHRPAGR